MPVVAVMAVASVAMQGYSMVQQNKASKASARTAQDVAAYNARVDMADAKQIELDATANTRAQRQDATVYLSRQKAAYASAGVLSSGSPLDAEVTTAGALEQRIQQSRSDAMREVSKREASARVGVLYGNAQADAIRRQNSVDMLRGGVGILQTVGNAYSAGAFASTPGPNTGAGMLAAGAPAGLASRSGL